jgi:hypothetical protein
MRGVKGANESRSGRIGSATCYMGMAAVVEGELSGENG